jgi:protein-disulfide isomerase
MTMIKCKGLMLKGSFGGSAMLAVAAALAAAPHTALAQDSAPAIDAEQREAIETVVRDYLLEHPEVLVEALQAYEQRQQAAQAERQRQAIVAEAAALTQDPDAPVLGNPDGDVTLVEFFDYRCPYCKRVSGPLAQLLEEDPKLRLVMKEFPILSQESVQAARAALAATRQGKYEDFHFALMENGGSYTDDEIMAVAQSVGLDEERLRADMQDPRIEAALRRTHALAERIGITGTPAFIIGDRLIPGAVGIDEFRAIIAETRAKRS